MGCCCCFKKKQQVILLVYKAKDETNSGAISNKIKENRVSIMDSLELHNSIKGTKKEIPVSINNDYNNQSNNNKKHSKF